MRVGGDGETYGTRVSDLGWTDTKVVAHGSFTGSFNSLIPSRPDSIPVTDPLPVQDGQVRTQKVPLWEGKEGGYLPSGEGTNKTGETCVGRNVRTEGVVVTH